MSFLQKKNLEDLKVMKDYKNMTQMQLEEELFKIYEKHNLEYYNDDMTEKYWNIKDPSELHVFGEDIENQIAIIRAMKHRPDLRRFYPDKKRILIHPTKNKEKEYSDFISRIEFINRTGIFVTPEYFDYIYDMEFKKADVSTDEFVNDYEAKYSTCVQEAVAKVPFKYELTDDLLSCIGEYDEMHEPNMFEIINFLSLNQYYEWKSKGELVKEYTTIIDKQQKVIETLKRELLLNQKRNGIIQ